MLDIAFAKPSLPKSGALVLLLEEGGGPDSATGAALREIDAATGGTVGRALATASFKGRAGQSVTILAPGAGLDRVVAIGLGKLDALTPLLAEQAGGAMTVALTAQPAGVVATPGLSADQAAAIAMGACLRGYRFDRYRTAEKPEDKPKLARLTLHVADLARARAAWAPLRAVAEGVFLARDLVSEPPNVLNPAELANRCKALEKLGLKVEIFGPKELGRLGFGALLGVSQGSANEPRMVVMHWNGGHGSSGAGGKGRKGRAKPLCFIGKGVTFDTGGISIKPAAGMEDMKWDMAGAGAVIGLMAALAGRRAKIDAIGLVGLVENMPGGTAQRPGDVVKTYSGQTVEVINTDAEGRLVLADVLWYCQQKYDPRFMIDLATLTGAIIVGLGHEYGGLFSNDDTLSRQLHDAGEATGEKLWRMPLHKAYDKEIKSAIADMKNVGGRPAGSITAAQFIQRFVNAKTWAHLDIAGMAWSGKDAATVPKGATAFGVRLLDRLVAEYYEG
jgi:leucyl aminopeptidase